jgi:hypothetical protein
LYKLGKDITISSPECYEFGKNTSFTIREGDLCLIGKVKHTLIKKIIYTQEATTSYSGLMSKEDKAKLNSIASNANNYSLPAASSSTRGGIKIGYTSTANNRAVQLNSEKAYVNIPDATTSQSGLMSSSDKEKLDGVNTYKHYYTALSTMDFN